MKLPLIDGRQAVPVRLLPFLTSWQTLPPDVVAALFSRRHEWHEWSISSFNLRPDGAVHELQPRAWNQCDDDLTTLNLDLQGQETFRFQKYAEWRVRSVDLMPPAVFVWRDELEREYGRTFGRMTYPSLRPDAVELSEEESEAELELIIRLCRNPETSAEADVAIARFKESAERNMVYLPGDGTLSFQPLLSAEEEQVAFAGFGVANASVLLGASQQVSTADGASAPLHQGNAHSESIEERRARLLSWFEEEQSVRGERGALQRVFERERSRRATADRSYIGKDIKLALAARHEAVRAGTLWKALSK